LKFHKNAVNEISGVIKERKTNEKNKKTCKIITGFIFIAF